MEKLYESIKNKSKDDKISCRVALDLAAEMGVSPSEVGEEINKLGIKIVGCQLGCFK